VDFTSSQHACLLDVSCCIDLCKEEPLSRSQLVSQITRTRQLMELFLMILIYSCQPASSQASNLYIPDSPRKKRHNIPIECCSSLQMHVWWCCGYMSANLAHGYTAFNQYHSPSVEGTGRLRSHLLPPGAVGALYGSGCFHFSRRLSVSSMINCVGCWISISSCPCEFLKIARAHYASSTAFPGSQSHPQQRGELTLCCLGSVTCLLASKRPRMYMAWPRQM
jgi:hypothetical protein